MMKPVLLIARASMLDAVRRRDLAVLGIFAGLLLAFLVAARWTGLEKPAAGTFLLNMSLTLVLFATHLTTLLVAARQFPEELEQRTLYPLLARPVRRLDVVLGKWAAAWMMGCGLLLGLLLPVLLLAPQLEYYDPRTLTQMLALQPLALMTTAAVSVALSLALPRGLAVAAALLLVFGADHLTRFAARFPLAHMLPNPSRLNMTVRYTDGIGPLSAGQWTALAGAGLLWTLALLMLAGRHFSRRNL